MSRGAQRITTSVCRLTVQQVAALRTLAKGEANAQLIQDSLGMIEGLRDALHRYVELDKAGL